MNMIFASFLIVTFLVLGAFLARLTRAVRLRRAIDERLYRYTH